MIMASVLKWEGVMRHSCHQLQLMRTAYHHHHYGSGRQFCSIHIRSCHPRSLSLPGVRSRTYIGWRRNPGYQYHNSVQELITTKMSTVSEESQLQSKNLQISVLDSRKPDYLICGCEGPIIHDASAGAIILLRGFEADGSHSHICADLPTPAEARVPTCTATTGKATPALRNKPDQCSNLSTRDDEVKRRVVHTDQLLHHSRLSLQNAAAHTWQTYDSTEGNVECVRLSEPQMSRLQGGLAPGMLDWSAHTVPASQLPAVYASLGKSRLTGLVVATAMSGYVMASSPFSLAPFLLLSVGTACVSVAANSINQVLEMPYDSQMARTQNRVLVRGVVSPLHAVGFAGFAAVGGVLVLGCGLNTLAAGLGLLNLMLYTVVYTPLKRFHAVNTWAGAVVGAIPPLMGWAAASAGHMGLGGLVMAAILYAWQFPHFNALSWNLRAEYSRAGYQMLCVTNPRLCRVTALRYTVALVALCSVAAPLADLTTWTYAVDSLPFNCYLSYLAWRFYKEGDSKSSRKLFQFSLIHLPAIMMLMIISKKHLKQKEEAKAGAAPVQGDNDSCSSNGGGSSSSSSDSVDSCKL